jgi:CO/xanthine dehydrogenase Mo-binding subunit
MFPGPYALSAYKGTAHVRITNKTPCGTYRAPGRFESTFARERVVDAAAAALGMDRIAMRRRNLIPPARMPYATGLDTLGTEVTYDSGDYERLLDRLLDHVDHAATERRLTERRAAGELVGWGVGFFVEKSGLGPFDKVSISLDSEGGVEVVTGAASLGQGIETAMAQICADGLAIAPDEIAVVHGQTDRIDAGMGAFASRATVMTGSATAMAAERLKRRVLDAAADLLQAPAGELVLEAGRVLHRDSPTPASVALGAVAAAQPERKLAAEATFETNHMTYPYGIHYAIAAVEAETGLVRLERYVVAYDVGRAVNPRLIEGQIRGGAAQGIGGALYERFSYDDSGEPTAVTFADYLMPTAAEVPDVEVVLTQDAPSPLNAMGLKGAGEGGANGAGAAIAGAVDDALQVPGAIRELPITPAKVRAVLREREAGSTCQS